MRGGKRPNAGRKKLDEMSETLVVPVTITKRQREILRRLGDGNVSRGVRSAIEILESCHTNEKAHLTTKSDCD